MFIHTTQTGKATSGETRLTRRVVKSRRIGDKVRQVTRPEADLVRPYDAPGLDHLSGGVQKLVA